jgi:DNA-binding HxlR family transcriptional regulator
MKQAQDMAAVTCSIERGLTIFGDRWTVLILRDAFLGTTRFGAFRRRLGIASDVLAERLAYLVEQGILEREPYQEPGRRVRQSYRLTAKGRDLKVVLGAMQQWGDRYLPRPEGPSVLRRSRQTGAPLAVAFVDDTGRAVAQEDAAFVGRASAAGHAEDASGA